MSFDDAIGPGSPSYGSAGDAMPAGSGGRPARPRYRPPVGIPNAVPEAPKWRGTVVSILLHALLVALVLAPLAAPALMPELMNQGAGGPGPAGGGGGGRRGTGGDAVRERVQYVQPPSAPAAPPDPAQFQQPVVPTPPVPATPTPPAIDIKTDVAVPDVASTVSAVRGSGGGTGSDGSSGSGPGSGGGVGSGVGTGRGTGAGPGTGGGPGTVYPPTPINVVIPPPDLAQKFRPYIGLAYFDVDERGQATLIAVQPEARDRGWHRRLVLALKDYRFRPAVRWDGTPVRDTFPVQIEMP